LFEKSYLTLNSVIFTSIYFDTDNGFFRLLELLTVHPKKSTGEIDHIIVKRSPTIELSI